MGKTSLRTKKYKLTDPFLLFYFWYIKRNKKMIAVNRSENLFRSITGKNLNQYFGLGYFNQILKLEDLL